MSLLFIWLKQLTSNIYIPIYLPPSIEKLSFERLSTFLTSYLSHKFLTIFSACIELIIFFIISLVILHLCLCVKSFLFL